jgi:hypothetical protein
LGGYGDTPPTQFAFDFVAGPSGFLGGGPPYSGTAYVPWNLGTFYPVGGFNAGDCIRIHNGTDSSDAILLIRGQAPVVLSGGLTTYISVADPPSATTSFSNTPCF